MSTPQTHTQPTRDTVQNVKGAAHDTTQKVQHQMSESTRDLAQHAREGWQNVVEGTTDIMDRVSKQGIEPALRSSADLTARQPMIAVSGRARSSSCGSRIEI